MKNISSKLYIYFCEICTFFICNLHSKQNTSTKTGKRAATAKNDRMSKKNALSLLIQNKRYYFASNTEEPEKPEKSRDIFKIIFMKNFKTLMILATLFLAIMGCEEEESCNNQGSLVFWYGEETSKELTYNDINSLTYYVDGEIVGSSASHIYWGESTAPDCGAEGTETIERDLGCEKSKTVSYKVLDDDDTEQWSGSIALNANTCTSLELAPSENEITIDVRDQAVGTYNGEVSITDYIYYDTTFTQNFTVSKSTNNENALNINMDGDVIVATNITEDEDGFSFDIEDQTYTDEGDVFFVTGIDIIEMGGNDYHGGYEASSKEFGFMFEMYMNDVYFGDALITGEKQ